MLQRGSNRGFRYTSNARNAPDASVPQSIMGPMIPNPLELVQVADGVVAQPLPISALATALAGARPEQQRAVSLLP